jgi:predicted porin
MNKTAIAVAVAGALAAPGYALAQSSTVQIGGNLHLIYGIADMDAPGGTAYKHDNMHMSEPEIYVRGEEALGGGLSAWFQCTSSFDVVGTQAQTASAGFCGRNSAIGFKGGWGNVFAGTWDTPHKLVFNQVRGWFSGTNVYGGGAVMQFGGSSSNVGNAGAVMGYRRQSRSLSYHSPEWSGFSVQGMFSAMNEAAGAPPAGTNPTLKPRLWSLSGNYKNGPLWVGAAYEKHDDYNVKGTVNGVGASNYNGGSDTGWLIGAAYTFGGVFKLSGSYAQNEWDVTNASKVKSKGYAVYGDWQIQGPHSLKAEYAKAKDPTGTAGASAGIFSVASAAAPGDHGAKVYGIDYAYDFSKRTQGYLGYAQMKNGGGTGAFTQGIAAASVGTSQKFYGMGLRHRF